MEEDEVLITIQVSVWLNKDTVRDYGGKKAVAEHMSSCFIGNDFSAVEIYYRGEVIG